MVSISRPSTRTPSRRAAYPRAERLWYVATRWRSGCRSTKSTAHQDRSLVSGADQGNRRHRARSREEQARGFVGRAFALAQAHGLFRPASGAPDKTTETDVRARRHALGIRRCTSVSTPAPRNSRPALPICTRPTRRVRGEADRQKEGDGARRRSESDRAGNRVRLLLRACRARATRRRVRDDHGQLQSETVSTDYDTSDRLYFEPLTLEDVLEIVHIEKPLG